MHQVDITCRPDEIDDAALIEKKIKKAAKGKRFQSYQLIRRWIDSRGRSPKFGLRFALLEDQDETIELAISEYQHVDDSSATVHIIGAGPAGYFAAFECLKHGLKPIVLEQGKDVRERRRDLKAIQQESIVNPHSNYCFGEGGAGTYSDGKLYTRAKKRGDINAVLSVLVAHGSNPDILIDAHPHIGSNKLPGIIANMRSTIERHGGEIHFNREVVDIVASEGRVSHLVFKDDKKIDVSNVILATGHSARKIYELFDEKGWALKAKSFALGARIEHPQGLIDQMQYGHYPRHDNLPAAAYRLACEVDERGVFSFCMCPGGLIVPAATAPGELVVNGMSLSRRDSPFANSGFVVSIEPEDVTDDPNDYKACLEFQMELERIMFNEGDGSQAAPAQRVQDFMAGRKSISLPRTSYIPGIYSARIDELLPPFIVDRMRIALKQFDRKLRGKYLHQDAVLVGIESRTSAPIKIPRKDDSLEHLDVAGLYPCGEGAGYAGGIMSAALDGQRVVQAILASF